MFRNTNFNYSSVLFPAISIAVFLCIWEIIPSLGWVNPLLTSSPSRIWQAAQFLFENGFWADIAISSLEFWSGFILAILIAIPTGIYLGWYTKIYAIFNPFISIIDATPKVAILPLLILWLGLGIESKIAIVFLNCLFPILLTVLTGMRTIDANLLKCARCFGANDRQIFLTIALRNSIPFIITGMRLAVSRGLIGVVVGEFFAANAGVGYMMSVAGSTFQTDKVFVGIALLTGFSYVLTLGLKMLESYCEIWREESSLQLIEDRSNTR